jgi:hypothetical protein
LAAPGSKDDRVARVWQVREQAEHEAAMLFGGLACELAAMGFRESFCEMALRASRDETEHAALCRGVVDAHARDLAPLLPRHRTRLGPPSLSRRQRALYEAVALSCVTETLSVALLLEMRSCVRDPPAQAAVTRIVRDESRHSQIGWAVLEHERRAADVSWLSPHIGAMLRVALESEEVPALEANDLGSYGILTPSRTQAVAGAVVREVILPGLDRYGIDTSLAGCPG